MEGQRPADVLPIAVRVDQAQPYIASAIRAQGLVQVDLTIPAQRQIANGVRRDLGLPLVGEVKLRADEESDNG